MTKLNNRSVIKTVKEYQAERDLEHRSKRNKEIEQYVNAWVKLNWLMSKDKRFNKESKQLLNDRTVN